MLFLLCRFSAEHKWRPFYIFVLALSINDFLGFTLATLFGIDRYILNFNRPHSFSTLMFHSLTLSTFTTLFLHTHSPHSPPLPLPTFTLSPFILFSHHSLLPNSLFLHSHSHSLYLPNPSLTARFLPTHITLFLPILSFLTQTLPTLNFHYSSLLPTFFLPTFILPTFTLLSLNNLILNTHSPSALNIPTIFLPTHTLTILTLPTHAHLNLTISISIITLF